MEGRVVNMKKKLLASFLSVLLLAGCLLSPGLCVEGDGNRILLDQDIVSFDADGPEVTFQDKFFRFEDPTATGGTCLKTDRNAAFQGTVPDSSEPGHVIFPLSVLEERTYSVWLRVYMPGVNDNNSIYWRIDENGVYSTARSTELPEWQWLNLGMAVLSKGDHTLELRARAKNNVKVDKVLISKKIAFIPQGENGNEEVPPLEVGKYYNAPPVIPPDEHPRLLARKQDIPAIRSNLESVENIAMYQIVKQNADQKIDGRLELGNNNTGTNHNHGVIAGIESSAFLYLIDPEGNRKYGEQAIQWYKNYTDTLIVKTSYSYHTRELGYTIFIGSMVYDWCYDLLAEEDKKNFIDIMQSYAMQMEIGWPPIGQTNFTGHAVEDQLMTDLISMSIALYDERPDIYQTVAGRFFDEVIPAQNFLYQGGALNEGPGYGALRWGQCVMNQWIFRRMGFADIYSKGMENALYAHLIGLKPSGQTINYGDVFGREVEGLYSGVSASYFLGYTYYKNPYFKYMFYKYRPDGNNFTQGNAAISPVLHLLLNVEPVEQKNISDLPRALFADKNFATILTRTNWKEGKADDAVNVRMHFYQYFAGSHGHADSGAFSIDYKGGLALDSGIYGGQTFINENGEKVTNIDYGSPHDVNYQKETIAHNAMLVRGDGQSLTCGYQWNVEDSGGQIGNAVYQNPGNVNTNLQRMEDLEKEGAKQGTLLSCDIGPTVSDPDYSYVKADITDAYPKERVENYVRQMMFLDFKDEEYKGALIVFDDITSANKDLEKVWLLHTEEEPQIEENTITVKRTTYGRSGRLINETLLPAVDNARFTTIGGKWKEFMVNGKNYPALAKYPSSEIGKYRVELTTKVKKKQDYFLNVMQISDNNDEIIPLKAELIYDDSSFAGVKISDFACFFSKSKQPYKKNISFEIPQSEESLQIIVTGLAEGEWTVECNGEPLSSALVDKEHDAMRFFGKGGSYVLKRRYQPVPVKDLSFSANIAEKNELPVAVKIGSYYESFDNTPVEKNDTL